MLRNLTIGQYVPGDSFLHRLDPRVKLVITMLAMIALFAVQRLDILAILGVCVLILGVCSKLSAGFLLRGLRFIWILAFFTFIFNAFLIPGKPVFSVFGFAMTYEGAYRGGAMALRLFLMVLITSVLSLTTSPILMTDAMERLLNPFRCLGLPSHELAMICTIALRFVPTLAQETDTIVKAQLARGASLDRGSVLVRAKALVPILVPLFVSAFRHAEDLAMAMEARCYRGGEGRTRLRELHFRGSDFLALALAILFMAVMIAGDWWLRHG
ncbi:MAG: energy-coupling factor transporter transmembrane protein EcfT [bacterium]|nr:energy-coupling factor transporter transmembrane protein EcfT [bacterium]